MLRDLAKIHYRPELNDARMVLGFSGWMDGGDASTGTIEYLVKKLTAQRLAEIDSGEFYIFNFPGSMEVSSLFRPHTKIENGLITTYREPTNTFFCDEQNNLILFEGKEPNIRWKEYAECILSLVSEFDVTTIYFVGSVAGLVPHTREPRFSSSVSDERLKPLLKQHGLKPSNYEGPASFVTYLMALSGRRGVRMASIVAEIPAYVQGRNIKCIEATARKLATILALPVDFDDLKAPSDEFERRLDEIVRDRQELADHIRKMEEDYDGEVVDIELADLKAWFEKQDIRLD